MNDVWTIIPWIVSIISLFGVLLNIAKNAHGFTIMTVANIILILFILIKECSIMYGQIPGLIAFSILNTWGYIVWTKEDKI